MMRVARLIHRLITGIVRCISDEIGQLAFLVVVLIQLSLVEAVAVLVVRHLQVEVAVPAEVAAVVQDSINLSIDSQLTSLHQGYSTILVN